MSPTLLLPMSGEQLHGPGRQHHGCGGLPAERRWALIVAVAAMTIPMAIALCF